MSLTTWFNETAAHLTGSPVLQGLLAAACTLVLEDPTSIACGMLVADKQMSFWTAYLGVSIGITVGDVGLYAIGRFLGPRVATWGFVSRRGLDKAKTWFDDNLISTMVVSRFVPGMRIPTFVGAGIFATHPLKFLVVALCASLAWTLCLMGLTIKLGEAIFPLLGAFKWPFMVTMIAAFIAFQVRLSRKKKARELALEGPPPPPVASVFEFWPPYIFYIPVALYYLLLSVKYRSLTLPTVSNPSIYSGGIARESKSQILSLVGEEQRAFVADYITARRPAAPSKFNEFFDSVLVRLDQRGLSFPLVAKPDIGQRGDGVQPVHDVDQLRQYLERFPARTKVILQKMVEYREEAGVMYHRLPGRKTGRILSITLKQFPTVTGDGESTLEQLIRADERACLIAEVYLRRHRRHLKRILDKGEVFPLVFSGNHCQGAIFKDGTRKVTPQLLLRIHEIASSMSEFYFGRFDIRYKDLPSLQRGEDFQIVEINAASAEATHIWDARMTLKKAYATLFRQFRILFEIGAANRARGFKPLGARRLLQDFFRYRRESKDYPPTL